MEKRVVGGAVRSTEAKSWAQLALMLSGAFSDPRAAMNLMGAQAADFQRAIWESGFARSSLAAQGEERILKGRFGRGFERSGRLFSPAAAKHGAPLVVMLHGCMQDSMGLARLTGMDALAAQEGFHVLYPDQETSANPMQCWNWNSEQNQRRLGGEPEALAQMVLEAQRLCGSPAGEARVAGISAGGAFAMTMVCLYPELFGSAVLVAAPLPFCAVDLPQALDEMANGPRQSSDLSEKMERVANQAALSSGGRRRLPVLIVQGASDETVHPDNANAIELAAIQLNDALAHGSFSKKRARSASCSSWEGDAVQIWRDKQGEVVAVAARPKGLGHAWSGGAASEPFSQTGFDQSRLALDFFSAAQTKDWSLFDPKALAARLSGNVGCEEKAPSRKSARRAGP